MSEAARRSGRVYGRLAANLRRAGAAVAAVGSARFPGGVDPPVEERPPRLGPSVVRGWVRGRPEQVVAVVVLVDGHAVALGQVDLADRRTDGTVTPWRAEVSPPLDQGQEVTAVVSFTNGLDRRLPPQLVGPAPAPPAEDPDHPRGAGNVEWPPPGAVVPAGLLTISGWTTLDPIARIEVTVDGETEAARQMARPRPDVAALFDSVHAAFCGFEHVVDVSHRADGEPLAIEVVAVGPNGVRVEIGRTDVIVAAIDVDEPDPVDADHLVALRARTARVTERHRRAADGIRLLAVTHDLGLGGGQLYLQELILRLIETPDLRCLVVSPTDGPLRRQLEAHGVEVYVTGPYPADAVAHESLVRQLAVVAGELEATAVVANTAGAAVGVDLADRLGLPALWAIHESFAPEHFVVAAYGPGAAGSSAESRLFAALESASVVIFEAEATRRLYCTHGDEQRFVRVDYGIPLASIDDYRADLDRPKLRAGLGLADDDVVLLCVGTIEPRKAQASLVRAFAGVAGEHPEATLVLVGDRGDAYGEALRDYVDRLDLGGRVRIEPVSPDCYPWYASADAFVLASDVESLPRSVLEAMAFDVPAIVADVFGLSDLIDDGQNGLLVVPRDLDALGRALQRFLDLDAADRLALGARGGDHIRTDHDSSGYARVYRRLLDGLAVDGQARPEDLLGR